MFIYPQYRVPLQQPYSQQPFESMNCILEPAEDRGGLYLSDYLPTIKSEMLIKDNIGAILSVAHDVKFNKTSDPRTQNIIHKQVLAFDTWDYDISQHFEECNQWIDHHLSQKVNVLVHCKAGVSRSATIVIAYVMKKFNLPYEKAYALVKSKRSRIQPNELFKNLLRQYQTKVLGLKSQRPVSARRSRVDSIQQPLKYSRTGSVDETPDDKPISPASQTRQILKASNVSGRYIIGNPNPGVSKANTTHTDIIKTPTKMSNADLRKSALNTPPTAESSGGKTDRGYLEQMKPEAAITYQYSNRYMLPTNRSSAYQQGLYTQTQPSYYYYQTQPQVQPQIQPQVQTQQIQPPQRQRQQSKQKSQPQPPTSRPRMPPLPPKTQKNSSWFDWFGWLNE